MCLLSVIPWETLTLLLSNDGVAIAIYFKPLEINTLVLTMVNFYFNDNTLKLVNKAESYFFAQHQPLLIDKILLELAKLYGSASNR